MADTDSEPALVTLYEFMPTARVVNPSPPCLKLETFLRMAKIPYKPVYGWKPSSKGKMPWIEYKDKSIVDSNFCIQFLSKEFGVDINEHLSEEQQAIATALLVMLEENTYWTLVYIAWCTDHAYKIRDEEFKEIPAPIRHILFWKLQRQFRGYLHGHGIGRHTEDELYGIAERDLRSISTFLGKKKFLFGDKPCITDAALFALVSCFIWEVAPCPQAKLITEELPNLVEHCKCVKEMYYPDWEEIVSKQKKQGQ